MLITNIQANSEFVSNVVREIKAQERSGEKTTPNI